MQRKDGLKRALLQVRSVTEELLGAFQTPQDWTYQVFDGANHALWVVGHIGLVDNHFTAVVDRSRARTIAAFETLFSRGSKPTNRPQDYPPAEEVLAYLRERRKVFLELLADQNDDTLSQATSPGTPAFLPDVASVFELAAWHEGLHSGQMSVARRALGHHPVH